MVFEDRSAIGEDDIIHYGRTALDYETLDKEQFGHFCAYEVNRAIARATTYSWLKGSEEEIKAKLEHVPLYVNKATSVDPSKKWVFDSKDFARLFDFCWKDDEPPQLRSNRKTRSSDVRLCVKPDDKVPALNFGKFSNNDNGKCEVFDATISSKQPPMTFAEWKAKAKHSPVATYAGVGWAIRDGQSFASHTAYGPEFVPEYCVVEAFIRGHRYCSIDTKGFYQTGNEIDYNDQYRGRNRAYSLNYDQDQTCTEVNSEEIPEPSAPDYPDEQEHSAHHQPDPE
ncbi:hypothetical protein [Endozoicomonas euniceicola]|uniref:Uncharacterized protein n=1 Tax=Endozoicomonas euniceicola TaxID=1234143 RepID=A0ABY6GZF8_9GAMM|nr:hypothetical protein [Endozoicomonas euniceicola]UYM17426.1 hypothetical protein NX720_05765 [Endozoicomonas euniceicola]